MQSPILEFEPGEWYLVVTCKNCEARQPMIHDLSRGENPINGIYNWTCPACGHTDAYDSHKDVERYRHDEGIS